jgi:hypothetical protein
MRHLGALELPAPFGVLDDTQGVDPEVLDAEHPDGCDGALKEPWHLREGNGRGVLV